MSIRNLDLTMRIKSMAPVRISEIIEVWLEENATLIASLKLPLNPKGKPRPRMTPRGRPCRACKRPPYSMFQPKTDYESALRALAMSYKGDLVTQPVFVTAYYHIECSQAPGQRQTMKPDLDNIDKASLDAIIKTILADDASVCQLYSEKIAAAKGGGRAIIKVWRLKRGAPF